MRCPHQLRKKSPGNSRSQGGEGLELLPGAIGYPCERRNDRTLAKTRQAKFYRFVAAGWNSTAAIGASSQPLISCAETNNTRQAINTFR